MLQCRSVLAGMLRSPTQSAMPSKLPVSRRVRPFFSRLRQLDHTFDLAETSLLHFSSISDALTFVGPQFPFGCILRSAVMSALLFLMLGLDRAD
jgi:hypothetical protein